MNPITDLLLLPSLKIPLHPLNLLHHLLPSLLTPLTPLDQPPHLLLIPAGPTVFRICPARTTSPVREVAVDLGAGDVGGSGEGFLLGGGGVGVCEVLEEPDAEVVVWERGGFVG